LPARLGIWILLVVATQRVVMIGKLSKSCSQSLAVSYQAIIFLAMTSLSQRLSE
jgi:hypothetical protein